MVILNNRDEGVRVDTKRFHEVIGSSTQGTDVVTKQSHALGDGLPVPARGATVLELN
jgi:hypothetical protein